MALWQVGCLAGADCMIAGDNIALSDAFTAITDLPTKGTALLRCANCTISIMAEGNRMVIEWNAETVKNIYPDFVVITETEWNAEYNRILNL